MVKYRLRFSFKKESVEVNREDNINSIISDIDCIISNDPIRKPNNDEIIEISGVDYKVESVKISFEKEGDITYYDFVVLLCREKKESVKDIQDRIKKMLELEYEKEKYKYKNKYEWYDNLKFK